jgi:hypothetical protein
MHDYKNQSFFHGLPEIFQDKNKHLEKVDLPINLFLKINDVASTKA